MILEGLLLWIRAFWLVLLPVLVIGTIATTAWIGSSTIATSSLSSLLSSHTGLWLRINYDQLSSSRGLYLYLLICFLDRGLPLIFKKHFY